LQNRANYLEQFGTENQVLKMHVDENRIVFIGDSIIAEWNESPLFKENSHYINRGINGQTTSQILVRFENDVIQLDPKCIVVLVGTNDIAENNGPISLEIIQQNFLSMVEIAKASQIKIILCSILPVSNYYWNPKIQPLEKIKSLNGFLASLANKEKVFYVDFYAALQENNTMHKNCSDDGVHPNLTGYAVLNKILTQSNYL
jgi:alpha-L-fucosidase